MSQGFHEVSTIIVTIVTKEQQQLHFHDCMPYSLKYMLLSKIKYLLTLHPCFILQNFKLVRCRNNLNRVLRPCKVDLLFMSNDEKPNVLCVLDAHIIFFVTFKYKCILTLLISINFFSYLTTSNAEDRHIHAQWFPQFLLFSKPS